MSTDRPEISRWLAERGHPPEEVEQLLQRLDQFDERINRESLFADLASGDFDLDAIIDEVLGPDHPRGTASASLPTNIPVSPLKKPIAADAKSPKTADWPDLPSSDEVPPASAADLPGRPIKVDELGLPSGDETFNRDYP